MARLDHSDSANFSRSSAGSALALPCGKPDSHMKVVRVDIDVTQPAGTRRTVLVLLDDHDWRDVVCRVLEQEGYAVLTARHAGHALLMCARHNGAIDLLITDEVTPDGRGRTIARALRVEQPAMRSLLFGRRPAERESLLTAVRSALI